MMYTCILPLKSKYHFLKVKESCATECFTMLGKFCRINNALELSKGRDTTTRGDTIETYELLQDRENECPLMHKFFIEHKAVFCSASPTQTEYEYYFMADDSDYLYHFKSYYKL